jgi:hypothetical protein
MTRKCSNCGAEVLDTEARLCPKCGRGLPEAIAFTNQFGHEQEVHVAERVAERLGKNWKFTTKVVIGNLLVVCTILGIIGIFFSFSINDSVKELQHKTDVRFALLDNDISNKIAFIQYSIETNIEAQFQDPHIREIMSAVAANQASNMMLLQIEPQIQRFNLDTSNTLAKFNDALLQFNEQSTNAISRLTDVIKFNLLVERANADDFQAVKQLNEYAKNYQSPFFLQAMTTVRLLLQRAYEDATPNPMETINWGRAGIDPDKASFNDLAVLYFQTAASQSKIMIMRRIIDENRFPKYDRLNWLVYQLQDGTSTRMTIAALIILAGESKLDSSQPFNFQNQIDWWNAHKNEYTNNVQQSH